MYHKFVAIKSVSLTERYGYNKSVCKIKFIANGQNVTLQNCVAMQE